MPLYRPSELNAFLESIGARPKKGLSQNFLIDGNIISKIVEKAGVQEGDLVLEIGPGPGALTEALLNAGAHVIAVEKDPKLAEALQRLSADRLEVHCIDILDFPLDTLPKKKLKVIGNLPYHITTPIIVKLLPLEHLFSSLLFMVQMEVGRRLTAKPSTPEYGSITLYTEYFADAELAIKVSKNSFYPVPKVDSAVVKLNLRPPPYVSNPEAYFAMCRRAFNQRRKILKSSLKELYEPKKIEKTLTNLHLSSLARPEELNLSQFIALFEGIASAE